MIHGKAFKSYVVGFISPIVLTVTAYVLVVNRVFTGWGLAYAIIGLALMQLLVQLLFFLHIGQEQEPRWNLLIFDFMALVVVIIVFGSLWIMYNLDYNHGETLSPEETSRQILEDEGIYR